MKKCTYCAAENADDTGFCGCCGKPFRAPQSAAHRGRRKSWLLVCLLAGAVLFAALILALSRSPSQETPPETETTGAASPAAETEQEGQITVSSKTVSSAEETEQANTASGWIADPYDPLIWEANLMAEDPFSLLGIDRSRISVIDMKTTTFDFTSEDTIYDLGADGDQRVIGKVDWYGSKAYVTIAAEGAINAKLCAEGLFRDCDTLEAVYGLEALRVRDAGSLAWMFSGCRALSYISFNGPGWDTSQITSMEGMFQECSALSDGCLGFLQSWDTSHVTNMCAMFNWCDNLERLDLSGFDTSGVTTMRAMFSACFNLRELNISSFDTSRVEDMSFMFDRCGLPSYDLGHFDTSSVTDMGSMFACTGITSLDLTSFDTSRVENMSAMFYSCPNLIQVDLSSFDTSRVTNMANMFYHSDLITDLQLPGFDVSNVTLCFCFMNEGGTVNGRPWEEFFGL